MAAIRTGYPEVAVWSGGSQAADLDVWFLHAFADTHEVFGHAFTARLAQRARILALDLPGHGESPARPGGLTVEESAQVWRDAIAALSSSRRVVLVAHSMGSIIATETARLLERLPELVISVEGNLTLADAYFSGEAARFADPRTFHAHFQRKILELAACDETLRRFSDRIRHADSRTLWVLGRSVLARQTPGSDFLGLGCPTVYYWDAASVGEEAKRFLLEHVVRHRSFDGQGHWPMIKVPESFYAAIEEDILLWT
jgi:pimeloyl-ACP methyl ester carboxylesterase